MNIKELSLNGFVCFKDKNLKFDGSTLIFGSNGSGKSALIDAISFVLYSQTIRRLDIINKDSESAKVTLTFNANNHTYKISRSISRDGNLSVELLKDGEPFTDDIDKEISNIFYSFNDFMRYAIIKQDSFIRLDGMSELITASFGLRYDEYNKEIEKRVGEYNDTLRRLRDESNSINSKIKELSMIDLDRLEKEIKELEKRVGEFKELERAKKRLAMLEKKEMEYINTRKEIEHLNAKIEILNEELKRREDELKGLEVNKKDYESIKSNYNELMRTSKRLALLDAKKVKYDILSNNISLLESIIKEDNLSALLTIDANYKDDYKDSIKKLREDMLKADNRKIELESKRYNVEAEINLMRENIEDILKKMKSVKESKKCLTCNQSLSNIKEFTTHMMEEVNRIKMNIKDKERVLLDIVRELRRTDEEILKLESMIIKTEISNEFVSKERENRMARIREYSNHLNDRLLAYKRSISALKFDKDSYDKEKKKYEELMKEDIIGKYIAYTLKLKRYELISKEINNIKNTLSILKKRLASITKEGIDYDSLKADLINTRNEIAKLEYEYNELSALLAKKKDELNEALKNSNEIEALNKRLEEIDSSIADANESIEGLKELGSILRDAYTSLVNKIIEMINPYISKFEEALKIRLSYENNTLSMNGIEFNKLSAGEKVLVYLILRLSFMLAVDTKLIIIDDGFILDIDKLERLISILDKPLILASNKDLRSLFNSVIELP